MNDFKKKWLGNSAANLMAGVSKALLDFGVPAIAVRALTNDDFSRWSLVLQVVSYVYLFGLGLQTAIAKYISTPESANEHDFREQTLSSAAIILIIAAASSLIFVLCLIWLYPILFKSIDAHSVASFRLAVTVVGFASCAQVLALLPIGVFMGLHQNKAFVLPQVMFRILTLLALWLVCREGASLATFSVYYSLGTAAVLPCVLCLMFLFYPWTRPQAWVKPRGEKLRRIAKYCAGMSLSMLSVLMVTSISTVIVGYYEFSMAGRFALAITMSTIIGGLLSAGMSPLIPLVSRMTLKQQEELPILLAKITFGTVVALIVLLFIFVIFGKYFLVLWIGVEYAESAYVLVTIIFVSNAVRFSMYPYCIFLQALALHGRAVHASLGEGVSNVFFSLLFGYWYGAIGVAFATVAAGVVGVIMHYSINFHGTQELVPDRNYFIVRLVIVPFSMAGIIWIVLYYARCL